MNFVEAALVESGAGTTVSLGGTELVFGPAAGGDARAADGVLLGIRPEHLGWRRAGEGVPGGFQARVELVEHIEPDAYVSASPMDPGIVVRSADEFVGDTPDDTTALVGDDTRFLTLRVSADQVPERGALIDLAVDIDRVCLFDIATGNYLGR